MTSSKAWLIIPGIFVPLWLSLCFWVGLGWFEIVVGSVLIMATAWAGWKW